GRGARGAVVGAAGVLAKWYGLNVVPYTLLYVCDPIPNSGTFVFPMAIAPAFRSRSTTTESCSGMASLYIGEPRVNGKPTAGCRSLNAIGSPCRGGRASPLAAR